MEETATAAPPPVAEASARVPPPPVAEPTIPAPPTAPRGPMNFELPAERKRQEKEGATLTYIPLVSL
jgi:hypothetical protein